MADSIPQSIADLRVTYAQGTFEPAELAEHPLAQFRIWFDAAVEARIDEPNAMVLATADEHGHPSSRSVLLKGFDEGGFTFFTNLSSRKSREIISNPHAAITFPWYALHRQVSASGVVEMLPRAEVEAYFRSRPRESQLGAWASEQSTVIADRTVLDDRWRELDRRYPDEIPVPEHWGGWVIRPTMIEFWQGRPSRLHDRLRYRATAGYPPLDDSGSWVVERLAP
ncbi:MAG: pyridoxamine 5'-phosphate oxidase [Actinobacteria bacterium]|nr:pyridoxamine 5'-phosphate oxidase [Actinomycetota bacterium]